MVALFLWLLDVVTKIRWQHEWLIFLLPIAGVAIIALYRFKGKNSEAGNNLIIDEIHKPGGGIPTRMAPFILLTTIVTHLFGGSAGREGTAIQMGGSMAHFIARKLKLNQHDVRILLMSGIAGGFAAVFGTPIAGTIFALEVLVIGKLTYDALLPCFITAIFSDLVCSSYGITHVHYSIHELARPVYGILSIHIDPLLLMWIVLAGICFGLTGFLFVKISESIKKFTHKYISWKYAIPFLGGLVIIGLTYALGTNDYLGLGVSTPDGKGTCIINAFKPGAIDPWGWFWKILFTAVTLSTGFKGGEVTPLFFIGATLGNSIGTITGTPVDLMAGLGFIAVFASVTNTPIACTIMGAELFGGQFVLYYAVACFIAYYFSGHTGIYSSQQLGVSKSGKSNLFGKQASTLKDIIKK